MERDDSGGGRGLKEEETSREGTVEEEVEDGTDDAAFAASNFLRLRSAFSFRFRFLSSLLSFSFFSAFPLSPSSTSIASDSFCLSWILSWIMERFPLILILFTAPSTAIPDMETPSSSSVSLSTSTFT